MTFNFSLFWRMLVRSFRNSTNTQGPLNRKRLIFLLLFYAIWGTLAIWAWIGFFLDDLLFPAYKKRPVEKPLFILSNFRCGSTFLHRVLARDTGTFTALRTCDIFLAPSITQRRIWGALARIDARFGGRFEKALRRLDAFSLGRVKIHRVGMFEPEEDETLLLYIWSTFFVGFLFPYLDDLPPYQYFDTFIPRRERFRIMNFYRGCLQRHLYATGGRHFVSKNPLFCAKIETLLEIFPDARIIYLARNPLEMLPSTISWLSYAWRLFSDPPEQYPFRDQVLQWTKYWHDHALKVLDQDPSPQRWILRYDDLVSHPDALIRELYVRLEYPQSSELEGIISDAVAEMSAHSSTHTYSVEAMGFSREEIEREYAAVFERFQFDRVPAVCVGK